MNGSVSSDLFRAAVDTSTRDALEGGTEQGAAPPPLAGLLERLATLGVSLHRVADTGLRARVRAGVLTPELRARALEAGKLLAAIRAIDSLIRLDGLAPPRQIRVAAQINADIAPKSARVPTLEESVSIINEMVELARSRRTAARERTGDQ